MYDVELKKIGSKLCYFRGEAQNGLKTFYQFVSSN